MDKMSHEQKVQALFITLVQQYQMQAWISLGKLKNPVTDKIERNLDLAKMSIDMLDMLKEKTRGNLSQEENRLLEQTLADLKLNYVDEYEKDRKAKEEAAEQKEKEPIKEEPVTESEKQSGGESEKKEKKAEKKKTQ